jgi:hypothetical protein
MGRVILFFIPLVATFFNGILDIFSNEKLDIEFEYGTDNFMTRQNWKK